jgi:VanZ family protein
MHIGYSAVMAQQYKCWGMITELSEQYSVSRTFIYMQASKLQQTSAIIFGDYQFPTYAIAAKLAFSHMLSLRMEGRCSIDAVSTIMKRFDIKTASAGSISQYLTY